MIAKTNETLNSADEYERLMKPVMTVGHIISMWPTKKDSDSTTIFLKHCHTFVVFVIVITTAIGITADVVHHSDNLEQMTDCALIAIVFYLATLRLTIYSLHQKDMLYILETMRSDWVLSTYNEMLLLREKCLFTFRLTKYFVFMVFTTCIIFIFVPFLEMQQNPSAEKNLPYRGYFFANQTTSPYFEVLYIVNGFAGLLAGCTISGATGFSLVAVMHGSAKFSLLQEKLRTIGNDRNEIQSNVKVYVKEHQQAIIFAEMLENITNVLALVQFVMSSCLVCFAGFQLTSMIENKGRLIKYSTFLNSAILELFLFSYGGNHLIDESGSLGFSVYESDWLGSNVTRSLQIIMMRTREPCRITAAKFYNMSFESFATVLSTSFSYFTVLNATKED